MDIWTVFGVVGSNETFRGIYSSREKAEIGAQEIKDEHINPSDNWWELTRDDDVEVTWRWYYEINDKITDTDRYVVIVKSEMK